MIKQGYISNFNILPMVIVNSKITFTISSKFNDYFIEDKGSIEELKAKYRITGNQDIYDSINGRHCEFDSSTNSFIRYL